MAHYTDIKPDLNPHPNTRDLTLDSEELAVKSSIRNIVFTDKYERFHNPSFGAGIPQNLFDNITRSTEYEITNRTREAILTYEPRVRNVQVFCDAADEDNKVKVTIFFTTINITKPITLQLILKRVR